MKEKKIKKKQPLREKRRRQMYSDNHEIGSFFSMVANVCPCTMMLVFDSCMVVGECFSAVRLSNGQMCNNI